MLFIRSQSGEMLSLSLKMLTIVLTIAHGSGVSFSKVEERMGCNPPSSETWQNT
jgi:hypothetical protein